jgi:hypothetical protein
MRGRAEDESKAVRLPAETMRSEREFAVTELHRDVAEPRSCSPHVPGSEFDVALLVVQLGLGGSHAPRRGVHAADQEMQELTSALGARGGLYHIDVLISQVSLRHWSDPAVAF